MYRLVRLNPWQEVTLVELLRGLLRYAHFDWSLIASYVALITSHEVIRTRELNFKMAASRFFQCYVIEENIILKRKKKLISLA